MRCIFVEGKQRAEELLQKIENYKEYSKVLGNSGAIVITINSLRNLLAGGVGRV